MKLFVPVLAFITPILAQTPLPTGALLTPTAAPNSRMMTLNPNAAAFPNYIAGQPVTTSVSPDGQTLLVLTSGYNVQYQADGSYAPVSTDWVFIYDISKTSPVLTQAVPVTNAFCGLAWNPSNAEFYASGGPDDNVHIFAKQNGTWSEAAKVALGHAPSALGIPAVVSGLAVNARGDMLLAANMFNDSVTAVDLKGRTAGTELDLRPGISDPTKAGVPGGENPAWIAIVGNSKAYVSSQRDREIVVLSLAGAAPVVTNRIPVTGQPTRMILNRAQNLLIAALDNSDSVVVIDTGADRILDTIQTTAPDPNYITSALFLKGSNPNSLALSPDEKTLYVTNGGTNSVAVIALNTYVSPSYVRGLIPTGWYPTSVSASPDGTMLYVTNAKNVPGPNPGNCRQSLSLSAAAAAMCASTNQYVWALEKGGMLVMPVPDRPTLDQMTQQVSTNNHFTPDQNHDANAAVMAQVRAKIQHVIYIIKENRTYDQVLGDLEKGNGNPNLALFGAPLTPNLHQIARQFVTLDNFYDSGEVSGVGWNWSTAGRATDYVEKTVPPSYAGRWGPVYYEYEGTNRNLNVGIAALSDRIKADPVTPADPNLLPGTADVAAPDSSEGIAGAGYLWDAAQRASLTVRNYGFYIDLTRYNLPASIPLNLPISTTPFASGIIQAYPAKQSLMGVTDQYFRGFDNNFPDYYRFQEWSREFDGFVQGGNLPQLSMVRFMHDHTGNFSTALFGVNTVESQVADNDYAVGLLLDKLSKSPYAANTLVFVIEDDAQDGPDHVDAHRSIAFIAGPYVKQGPVVSTRYNTVNFLRTMKDVLGISYMGIYDGTAEPMADAFDLTQSTWSYTSLVPDVLRTTQLPVPAKTALNSLPDSRYIRAWAKPRHTAAYWARVMEGQNFDKEDDLDEVSYNRALWIGLKGKRAKYPEERDGADLSQNREELLKNFH